MKLTSIVTILVLISLFSKTSANAQTSATTATLSNCQTQIVTLNFNGSAGSYPLATNQIVYITSYNMYQPFSTYFTVNFPDGNTYYSTNLTEFTGATNFSIYSSAPFTRYVTLTVLTPSTNAVTYTPANSVVIPSDAKGNVQIILQSSSDLVNWVPSLPGTYGSTYSNRFFRVIAVAQ